MQKELQHIQKNVIENGKLTTFLHNLKTAKKDNVQPTGNAYKSSYKGDIGIAPSNMFIEPQNNSYEEMIKDIEKE